MHRAIAIVLFLLTLLLPACRTWHSSHFVAGADYVLATREADGKKETFELQVRAESLRVTMAQKRSRQFLGLQVTELDKAQAERRGVQAYSGLLVTGTYPKSAAAEGGIEAGDVLQAIGERQTVYASHITAAEAGLTDGQEVVAKVLRGQQQQELTLRVRSLTEDVTEAQDIKLDASDLHEKPYAGVTLRGIPAVWCERIFGTARNAVVVTQVEVGSPAWLAGVRGGDVIDAVDGQPVPNVTDLSKRIAELGATHGTMQWSLRRGVGETHTASIELDDYSGESHFWIPFIVHVDNGVTEDFWSLGPLALLVSNRNQYVADSGSRRVQTRNVFNLVLGLIHVDSRPSETEVRLLWFIHFDT